MRSIESRWIVQEAMGASTVAARCSALGRQLAFATAGSGAAPVKWLAGRQRMTDEGHDKHVLMSARSDVFR